MPAPSETSGCILAGEENRRFAAATEKHAFAMLERRLEMRHCDGRVVYFAFPWSTLIDGLLDAQGDERSGYLGQTLRDWAGRLRTAETVVTACQHTRLPEFRDLFADVGVTEIFWPHMASGQAALPGRADIRLHPFPLHPGQAADKAPRELGPRQHLFSFVSPGANGHPGAAADTIIADALARDRRGLIVTDPPSNYGDVIDVIAQGVFALCPAGTGANAIRIWEALALGTIPVITSDALVLPGNPDLWTEAAVFCGDDRQSIIGLPDRLAVIQANPAQLTRKRHAASQLLELYGVDSFVTDIQKLMILRAQEAWMAPPAKPRPPAPSIERPTAPVAAPSPPVPVARTQVPPARTVPDPAAVPAPALSDNVEPAPGGASLPAPPVTRNRRSLTTITSEILMSPESIAPRLRQERAEIAALLEEASEEQRSLFARALALRGLEREWED